MRLIVVPLGGGGLISGIALAFPEARVVGVRCQDLANTICDGIAVKKPGAVTAPLLERHVDEIVSVTDDEVAEAMVLLLERSKLVVEGAGAVAVAALLHGRVKPAADGETCAVLSGGNVDASLLSECIRMGETAAGRRMVLSTKVPDRPGGLARLLDLVAEHGANVMDVEHLREGIDLHVRETAIQLVIQTRGRSHGDEILRVVADAGLLDQVRAASRRRRLKRARAEGQRGGEQAERDRDAQRAHEELDRVLERAQGVVERAAEVVVAAASRRRRPRPRGRGSRTTAA